MNTNKSISVLTIDDDADLRKGIVSYLEDKGFTVYQASDGADGIEMFRIHNPDLVLTDLMMPGVDGLSVVSAIMNTSPDTPVVVISGNGSVAHAIEAVRKGAWEYITKPIYDFAVIDRVIDQVFDRVDTIKSERAFQENLQKTVQTQIQQLDEIRSIDALTKLPKRGQLCDMFSKFITQADFSGNLSVTLLEIENFNIVNETYGHGVGDQFILNIVDRLRPLITTSTAIAHISTNEFAILIADCADVSQHVRSLSGLLEKPANVMDQDIYVGYNIGIAMFPHDGESIDTLLHHAEIARAYAKSSGRNCYSYYSRELREQLHGRVALESGLRKGLERNEFKIYYQPKVDAATRRIVGMEALLRWQPAGSDILVSPDIFIPILEESGLIVDVGAWVLETACRQHLEWLRQGMGTVRLSVNISAIQFHSGDLPSLVARVLQETGLAPNMLCLELTESIVAKNIVSVIDMLAELACLGVTLSIDDFGTGYSSLSYLKDMPINELKIDRSFVMNLPENSASVAIVESVLNMSKVMRITVVAEGVETSEQADFLVARGCHELQGYLFSRPLPQEEVLCWSRGREHIDFKPAVA